MLHFTKALTLQEVVDAIHGLNAEKRRELAAALDKDFKELVFDYTVVTHDMMAELINSMVDSDILDLARLLTVESKVCIHFSEEQLPIAMAQLVNRMEDPELGKFISHLRKENKEIIKEMVIGTIKELQQINKNKKA